MPKTVKASITNGVITVEGPKGKLSQEISPAINVAIEDGKVVVTRDNDEKQTKAYHGLMRQLIHNMIIGVSEGYQKNMVIICFVERLIFGNFFSTRPQPTIIKRP